MMWLDFFAALLGGGFVALVVRRGPTGPTGVPGATGVAGQNCVCGCLS